MPLLPQHCEMIAAALSEMTEFSTDDQSYNAEELATEVHLLKEAILNDVPPKHLFYSLNQCLYKTRMMFPQFVSHGLQLGEIHTYILSYLTKRIQSAAEKAQTTLAKIAWDHEAISTIPTFKASQTINFDHLSALVEETLYYDHLTKNDNDSLLYRFSLDFSLEWNIVFLSYDVFIPKNNGTLYLIRSKKKISFKEYPTQQELARQYHGLSEDARCQAFEQDTAFTARNYVEKTAGNILIQHLRELDILTAQEEKMANISVKQLVLHPFYYQALITAKILQQQDSTPLSDFRDRDTEPDRSDTYETAVHNDPIEPDDLYYTLCNTLPREVQVLLHPGAIYLLQKNICNIETIKYFTLLELNIISLPLYRKLILNNPALLHDFLSLENSTTPLIAPAAALSSPCVIKLIHDGILNISDAKRLPACSLLLLNKEFYLQSLREAKITWQDWFRLNPSQAKIFEQEEIVVALQKNLVSFDDLMKIPQRKSYRLSEMHMGRFILTGEATLQAILDLSDHIDFVFYRCPELCLWLNRGELKYSDLSLPPDDLIVKIAVSRLIAILHGKPSIVLGKEDSAHQVHQLLNYITGCSLVLTSSVPNKERLNDLPIKSNSAYVRVYNQQTNINTLFYIDKESILCSHLKMDKKMMIDFDKVFKPRTESCTLSNEQLEKIAVTTGYGHRKPDAAPSLRHQVLQNIFIYIRNYILSVEKNPLDDHVREQLLAIIDKVNTRSERSPDIFYLNYSKQYAGDLVKKRQAIWESGFHELLSTALLIVRTSNKEEESNLSPTMKKLKINSTLFAPSKAPDRLNDLCEGLAKLTGFVPPSTDPEVTADMGLALQFSQNGLSNQNLT